MGAKHKNRVCTYKEAEAAVSKIVLISVGLRCLWLRIDARTAFWSTGVVGNGIVGYWSVGVMEYWSVGLKYRNLEDRRGGEGSKSHPVRPIIPSLQVTPCARNGASRSL
jgi:hypothetical protein